MRKQLTELSSDQLRDYLKDGSIMLGEVKIEPGWLRVEKIFKDKYATNEKYGCATDEVACVLLDTTLNENLKLMGQSR